MKRKWMVLTALTSAGALLWQNGCLSALWQDMWRIGFQTNNRWLNLAIDAANEVLFG